MTSWVARIFASILITGLAAGAANAQGAEPYLLQPLDVVEITVLEDKELNRTALVRPDGKISLPLAGTVQAAGRTPEQVAEQQAADSLYIVNDFAVQHFSDQLFIPNRPF